MSPILHVCNNAHRKSVEMQSCYRKLFYQKLLSKFMLSKVVIYRKLLLEVILSKVTLSKVVIKSYIYCRKSSLSVIEVFGVIRVIIKSY
jgi:hypothetical protein